MKNEKQALDLNLSVHLFLKLKNHFVLCFMSQLQYKNENQILFLISYFNFSKKKRKKKQRNGTLGKRIQKYTLTGIIECI